MIISDAPLDKIYLCSPKSVEHQILGVGKWRAGSACSRKLVVLEDFVCTVWMKGTLEMTSTVDNVGCDQGMVF